jgi:hypothetical protein
MRLRLILFGVEQAVYFDFESKVNFFCCIFQTVVNIFGLHCIALFVAGKTPGRFINMAQR